MKKRAITLLLLCWISWGVSGCFGDDASQPPKATHGKLEINQDQMQEHGRIALDGQWEFYWQAFIDESKLEAHPPDFLADVPATWDRQESALDTIPGHGHATYRLRVHTDLPPGTRLGLDIPSISSAASFHVGDQLIGRIGRPSALASDEIGAYNPQTMYFDVPEASFDLIVHVSNHVHARGGLWQSVYLGQAATIAQGERFALGMTAFLLGALFLTGLFFLAVHCLRPEFRYALHFGLVCLSAIVTIDMLSEFFLPTLMPGLSLTQVIVIWYLSLPISLMFLLLYMHELFRSKLSQAGVWVFGSLLLLQVFLTMVLPIEWTTRQATALNGLDAFRVLFILAVILVGARRRSAGAVLNVLSVLVLLISFVHDVLLLNNVITSGLGLIAGWGVMLFVFMQMILQAYRIRAYQDEKISSELRFFQAQIKPHFLFNSINAIISISRVDAEQSRSLLQEFARYLRHRFDIGLQNDWVWLSQEIERIQAYLAIEKARHEERLKIRWELAENLDVRVPVLTLQPLVENAIQHGIMPKRSGGTVTVTIRREEKRWLFAVSDDGVGMDEKKVRQILRQDAGQGIGLKNIDERLRRFFGRGLKIESVPGKGTTVSYAILQQRKRIRRR